MGLTSSSSEKVISSHCIKKKLRSLPFERPTEKDFKFLTSLTNLDSAEIEEIIQSFVSTHPDGKMSRDEFCSLYHSLRKESPDIVSGLSDNIFRALDVTESDIDLISLREFLVIYALTSRGDLQKRLNYALDIIDTGQFDQLELNDAKELICGILELYKGPTNTTELSEVARETIKHTKITQIVRRGLFVVVVVVLVFLILFKSKFTLHLLLTNNRRFDRRNCPELAFSVFDGPMLLNSTAWIGL